MRFDRFTPPHGSPVREGGEERGIVPKGSSPRPRPSGRGAGFTIKIKAQEALASPRLGQLELGLVVWALSATAMASAAPAPSAADKQELHILAQVDKTEVELGTQLTLTITIEGDFAKTELQPFEFPKAFQVIAQSRASNLSLQVGAVKRSVSLSYVLMPKEAGTFQLGPFQVTHQGKAVLTDSIQIVVKKPLMPPTLQEHQRYTL